MNSSAFMASLLGTRAQSPNDPKLSDRGVRRGTCMVGGKATVEAGAVTHGAVRCSAWLGDGSRQFISPHSQRLAGRLDEAPRERLGLSTLLRPRRLFLRDTLGNRPSYRL